MRNMPVPQTGHLPFQAGFPFFITILFGSLISRVTRHLTQYPLIAFPAGFAAGFAAGMGVSSAAARRRPLISVLAWGATSDTGDDVETFIEGP